MPRWRKVWIREYRGKRGTSYRVSYFDTSVDARRTIRTFHNKRLAQGFKNEFESYLNGEGPCPGLSTEKRNYSEPPRLWAEAVEAWLEGGAIREKTRSTYRSLLTHFAADCGITAVEDVSESTIATFLMRAHKRGRSQATCAAYLRTLAAFFNTVRPTNSPITPALRAKWKPYKTRKRERPHYFTEDEFENMLEACDTLSIHRPGQRDALWWKCFIAVLYRGGLRLNEAAHLIWHDIDFDTGTLKIQPHARLKGVFDWRPKGKAHRTIPVPGEVIDLLTQMQDRQREGIPYVFVSANRYEELIAKDAPKRGQLLHGLVGGFKRVRNLAGIPEGTIHDMRRSCTTNWLRHPKLTAKDVQLLAGHEDLKTTLDIYAMVEEEDAVEKAREAIR